MKIKASGRSALILATGLLVCFAGPSQAAAGHTTAATASSTCAAAPIALNKYTRHGSRHWRRYAHRKSSKVAVKSADDKATESRRPMSRPTTPTNRAASSSDIPPSVANANAQLASADAPTSDAAKAMSARANNILQNAPDNPADAQPAAGTQVVAADQLNDVDRALHEANAATLRAARDGLGRAARGLRRGAGDGRQRARAATARPGTRPR